MPLSATRSLIFGDWNRDFIIVLLLCVLFIFFVLHLLGEGCSDRVRVCVRVICVRVSRHCWL
jgi:hypothetical protein